MCIKIIYRLQQKIYRRRWKMRGGYRPGSGPEKGTKYRPRKGKESKPLGKPKATRKPKIPPAPSPPVDPDAEKIRQMLKMRTKATQRLFGDFMNRVARGEKLTVAEINKMEKLGAELEEENGEKAPAAPAPGDPLDLEAAEYLRKVWNDPTIDHSLRIRAAEIIAKGPEKLGKKEEKSDRAKAAGAGKFAAGRPPISVVK
jgi:hypothetical protein